MKKSNPTPALPLSGEGVRDDAALLAPPPGKGEAGRGLSNKIKLHNLKPQIPHRKQNRKNPTEPEKYFWSWVRGKQLGCKFRRQHGIGQYIVDFYCAEHALIVELDGESHFTAEGNEADKIRTAFLESKGFRVLRFSNLEVMQNKEGVLMALVGCLNTIKSYPTPALPLSGEGAGDDATLFAPPSGKGEVGRGLKTKKVDDND